MKHEDIKNLLPLYVDGGLNMEEMQKVEQHLETCTECQNEVEEYQQNLNLFLSSGEEKLTDEFLRDVIDKVNDIEINKEKQEYYTFGWLERIVNLLKVKLQIPAAAFLGMMTAAVILVILVFPFNFGDNRTEFPGSLREQSITPEIYKSKSFNLAQRSMVSEDEAITSIDVERKIIKNADLKVELNNLEQLDQTITKLVQEYEGYIANSGKWLTSNKQEHERYRLRIPVESFYQLISRIEDLGQVVSSNISGRDVTEEYIDLESRLKNLQLQEERYRELLKQADKVEDILKIEKELERARSTIESLLGRKKYLDNQVAYSTINVEFVGPEPITAPTHSIERAIRQSLRAMTDSFYHLLIRLGSFIPYLILLALFYAVYRIYRRRK